MLKALKIKTGRCRPKTCPSISSTPTDDGPPTDDGRAKSAKLIDFRGLREACLLKILIFYIYFFVLSVSLHRLMKHWQCYAMKELFIIMPRHLKSSSNNR